MICIFMLDISLWCEITGGYSLSNPFMDPDLIFLFPTSNIYKIRRLLGRVTVIQSHRILALKDGSSPNCSRNATSLSKCMTQYWQKILPLRFENRCFKDSQLRLKVDFSSPNQGQNLQKNHHQKWRCSRSLVPMVFAWWRNIPGTTLHRS